MKFNLQENHMSCVYRTDLQQVYEIVPGVIGTAGSHGNCHPEQSEGSLMIQRKRTLGLERSFVIALLLLRMTAYLAVVVLFRLDYSLAEQAIKFGLNFAFSKLCLLSGHGDDIRMTGFDSELTTFENAHMPAHRQ